MFILRPLQWTRQEHDTWQAHGICHTYTIRPEHKRLRLVCSNHLDRPQLYDFDEYYDAMVFAQSHQLDAIRPFIKEVTHESHQP